jgi:hypothetical protein
MRQAYYPVRVVCATLDAPPFHGRNTDHRAASPSFKIAGSIRESSEDSLWHPGRRKNTIFRSWRLCPNSVQNFQNFEALWSSHHRPPLITVSTRRDSVAHRGRMIASSFSSALSNSWTTARGAPSTVVAYLPRTTWAALLQRVHVNCRS